MPLLAILEPPDAMLKANGLRVATWEDIWGDPLKEFACLLSRKK